MIKRCFVLLMLCFALLPALPQVSAKAIDLPFGAEKVDHLPKIGLKSEGGTTVGTGVAGVRGIADTVGSFLTLILNSIAVVALFVGGYNLMSAQSQASEQMSTEKMNVLYVCIGLIVFALASEFVYQFLFFDQGQFFPDADSSLELASKTTARIKELLNLFLSFSGAGAILMLVIASLRLVINPGSDDQIDGQKKLVAYTAMGIIMIGLADTLVNVIIFPQGGYSGVNVSALELQLTGLSNYILGFLGAIVFVSFLISGVLLVINMGNEDIVGKIKTTLKNIVIGALVAFSSYTVVATLLGTLLLAEGGV